MVREIHFISSWAIVNYIIEHPIDWSNREMASLGGLGDQANPKQVLPMVEMFIRLLAEKKGLFTQAEFADYCFRAYAPWPPEKYREGVKAKMYRNVYPSMIDHLHVFALLAESRIFKSVDYDTSDDVLKKLDIVLTRVDDRHLGLAIRAGTAGAKWAEVYKKIFRGVSVSPFPVIPIVLDMKRRGPTSRGAGNKRWFILEDFLEAIRWATEGIWSGPINR
jgi:hypothetical protein